MDENNGKKENSSPEPQKNTSSGRKNRPVTFILVLCLLLCAAALVFNVLSRNLDSRVAQQELAAQATPAATEAPPEEGSSASGAETASSPVPTPELNPDDVLYTNENAPVLNSDGEHTYLCYSENISWEKAKEKCDKLGGYLATVSDQEELDKVIAAAAGNGLTYVWIGCHRENGNLVWENGETIDFAKWAAGEPSYKDGGDGAVEDYILLWNNNGKWFYNDSRNDPCQDYGYMFNGKIGYVCEIG